MMHMKQQHQSAKEEAEAAAIATKSGGIEKSVPDKSLEASSSATAASGTTLELSICAFSVHRFLSASFLSTMCLCIYVSAPICMLYYFFSGQLDVMGGWGYC